LIPAYNSEKWVGQAIHSALTQTWPKKEVVVVDDGSRDHTLSVARTCESKLCRVLSQENRGASAARNHALSYAQGDFIQWLDADDLLAPDKIEQQLKRGELDSSTRILLSSAFCRFFHRTEKAKFLSNSLCQDLAPLEFMLIKFRYNLWMNPSVWLVSRTLTQMAGPWDESLSLDDDGEYFCRVVLASERILFVPQARSYKRIGVSGNLSGRITLEACRSQFQSMSSSIHRVLAVEDNERVRESCLTLLQTSLLFFYPDKAELMDKVNELARFLGGDLAPPKLGWKYSPIQKVFGWGPAMKAKHLLPATKRLMHRTLDRMLCLFSS
jgi:glycosyltransferase involved in cell wall biosynthesis